MKIRTRKLLGTSGLKPYERKIVLDMNFNDCFPTVCAIDMIKNIRF